MHKNLGKMPELSMNFGVVSRFEASPQVESKLTIYYSAVVIGGIFGTIGKAGANRQDIL
jgi:hypothetical protein